MQGDHGPAHGRELDLFETKFDVYCCIVVKRGKEVTLFSPRKKVLGKRLPGILEAFA